MRISRLGLAGDPAKGLYSRPEPALGCSLCYAGVKAVIFVTGVCDDSCFYCPVSRERLGHDVFYVNEEPVSSVEELAVEVQRTGAHGASITGGDPLVAYDRVTQVVSALKDLMGPKFHIHLYTSGRYATPEVLRGLERAGLDEIRFHPTLEVFEDRIRVAVEHTSMDVGVEIPIAPRMVEWAKRIILKASKAGAKFVNLNEMEFVEPNARALLSRGYREDKRRPFTVEGSYEAAIEVLEWARNNVDIPVHFCPAQFKDAIQTRNRLRRLALLDRAWNEEATSDGTLLWEHECSEGVCVSESYPTRSRRPVVATYPLTNPITR